MIAKLLSGFLSAEIAAKLTVRSRIGLKSQRGGVRMLESGTQFLANPQKEQGKKGEKW